ncbi:MAG: hypothetical protein FWF26_00040, partial [Treponema sp.]|nr:hypothetical protein [Treponema sp.]
MRECGYKYKWKEENYSPKEGCKKPEDQKAVHTDAIILDIVRKSSEDGPGLRTTVYFKGCHFLDPWDASPESGTRKPKYRWYSRKCISCYICQKICPQKEPGARKNGMRYNHTLCLACASC